MLIWFACSTYKCFAVTACCHEITYKSFQNSVFAASRGGLAVILRGIDGPQAGSSSGEGVVGHCLRRRQPTAKHTPAKAPAPTGATAPSTTNTKPTAKAVLTAPGGGRSSGRCETEGRSSGCLIESRGCRPKGSAGGRTRRAPAGTELLNGGFDDAEAVGEVGIGRLNVGIDGDGRRSVDIEVEGVRADAT
jgi:hypothetical protein